MSKLQLSLMYMLLLVFLLTSCFAQERPDETGANPSTETQGDDSEEVAHGGSNSPSSAYQQGFDRGYKVGYYGGYQTGFSDALRNYTTNMTSVFEGLGLGKKPVEEKNGERSLTEIYLSVGLLVFGFLLALLQTAVVIKKGAGWERNSIRLIGLTLVLTFGAVLLPVGYSAEQVTPLMTLLGIVAGYLLAGIDLH